MDEVGGPYSAMRRPAQRPATPPTPLKSSDWRPSPLAPHIMGMKPPVSVPNVAHIMIAERPMPN